MTPMKVLTYVIIPGLSQPHLRGEQGLSVSVLLGGKKAGDVLI